MVFSIPESGQLRGYFKISQCSSVAAKGSTFEDFEITVPSSTLAVSVLRYTNVAMGATNDFDVSSIFEIQWTAA